MSFQEAEIRCWERLEIKSLSRGRNGNSVMGEMINNTKAIAIYSINSSENNKEGYNL